MIESSIVEIGYAAETSLLTRAVSGDRNAWNVLVEFHAPSVYRTCRRHGLTPLEARDVGVRVFRRISDLMRNRPGFAEGSCCDLLREYTMDEIGAILRDDPRTTINLSDDQSVSERPVSGDSELAFSVLDSFGRIARYARDQIAPQQWNVFCRVTIKGEEPAVVAAELSMPLWEVHLLNARVFRRLRTLFAEPNADKDV